ncbi:uncharacterized protein DNG_01654 [Cephalotrichum gorgonifer]|uniref:Uncharacterized protein n=1 Tax=Cephalotrichum gorgonifer TaxID=2041049 RepID=A0AAE8MRZ3_9PEZI|nr:uncharacterized protein DNG_01654 [Cephalotrichum gorgonifer]
MVSVAGGFAIAVLVILILVAVGWVAFAQLRARRLGIPPPPLSSYIPFRKSNDANFGSGGGIGGWFSSRISGFKNRNNRSAAGAYEPSGGARGTSGPLDPDDAWDSRVHDGYGYQEEQELESTGYHGAGGSGDRYGLGNSSYEMNVPRDEEEGRGRTGRGDGSRNPFEDDAEASNISIRGVSPRPMDGPGPAQAKGRRSEDTDRRSAFREEM